MSIKLPMLPYAASALEPAISGEAIRYHHTHHHAAYIKAINHLATGALKKASLEQLIATATGPLANAAGQAWNHTFYWHSMAPKSARPDAILGRAIDSSFGSLDALKRRFIKEGLGLFGSGWVWLVVTSGSSLEVVTTPNAGLRLHEEGWLPLLVCDVWEHAYYADYRGDRKAYLNAFWRVVNWEGASWRFAVASRRAASSPSVAKRRPGPVRGVRWRQRAVQASRRAERAVPG